MSNRKFHDVKLAVARSLALLGGSLALGLAAVDLALAQSASVPSAEKARIFQHWTPERRAQAIPRDLVIDPRGLGYLRGRDGRLTPYGHEVAAQTPPRKQTMSPFGKPSGGSGDVTGPVIVQLTPANDATIGSSATFTATVTDIPSGVKSVTFNIQKVGSTFVNSFGASQGAGDNWTLNVSGFTDGAWEWWVVAKDNAGKGGNTSTSDPRWTFTVDTSGNSGDPDTPPPADGQVIRDAEWSGGAVQTAAGRIYFYMPGNSKLKGPWTGYVCSGTVATDPTTGRSIIITAAHCVYDDVNKAFAKDVMFIPNQAGSKTASGDVQGTDRNCSNDPIGCWVPSFGVVDTNWTSKTFPANIAWDYAYYVVENLNAHQGTGTEQSLETAAGSLTVIFTAPDTTGTGAYTHALGYSYNQDPQFRYCAQNMVEEPDKQVDWWLGSCELSGGSSGGPWVQPMDTTTTSPTYGSGPIISVNSWGYTTSPGMAGPKLSGRSASALFGVAQSTCFPSSVADGSAGVIYYSPTVTTKTWSCQP